MKAILAAVMAIFLLPLLGNAQASFQRWNIAIQKTSGSNFSQTVPGASVYVCQYNDQLQCNSQIPVYYDSALTMPASQPIVANDFGEYSYYIQSGTKVIEKVCGPYASCNFYALQIGGQAGVVGCNVSGSQGFFFYYNNGVCQGNYIDYGATTPSTLTLAAPAITAAASGSGGIQLNTTDPTTLEGNGSPICTEANGFCGAAYGVQYVPQAAGQYVLVYAHTCGVSQSGISGSCSNTSGGLSGTNGDTVVTWTDFTLPDYVNPANITSAYLSVTASSQAPNGSYQITNFSPFNLGGGSCSCSPGTFLPNHSATSGVAQTSVQLNTLPTNYSAVQVGIEAAGSIASINGTTSIYNVVMEVHYTGPPPPASPFTLYIAPPLTYDVNTTTLGISQRWPNFIATNTVSQIASLYSPSLRYQVYPVIDGQNSTDCTTGSGGTFVWCMNDGGSYTAVSSGGGSGVSYTSPTLNFIPKVTNATAPGTLGNSSLSDNGTVLSTSEQFNATNGLQTNSLIVNNATSGTITIQAPAGALGAVTNTLQDVSDTFVYRATTDTLTNKTINGSNNTLSNISLSSLAGITADSVVMNASGGTASPTAVSMPTSGTNGCAGASNALTYNTSTHLLGCNTITASGLSFPATVSGTVTSGGIPYFSGTTTMSSSALLGASGLVLGGGAGTAPSTVAGISSDGTSVVKLGVAGTSVGGVQLFNATSGSVTINPASGALGSVTATLPANTGTIAELNLAQSFSALQTFGLNASIGTTAHGVIVSENSSAIAVTAAGTANAPLLSGGAAADPSYSTILYPTSLTSGGVLYGSSTTQIASSAALTSNSLVLGGGAGSAPKVVAGIVSDGTSKLTLGVAGTSVGAIAMNNATSGSVTLQPVTGALGAVTASLPANTGTIGELNLAQTWSALQTFGANASIGSTAHAVLLSQNTSAVTALAVGTAKQILTTGGSGADPSFIDYPHVLQIPAANCNNATPGTGWSLPASGAPTAACRTGTNVQAGVLQFAASNTAQFQVDIPNDWDSAGTVYAKIHFSQGANTTASQTIIMQIATGCGATDDPSFNAAQNFSTATTVGTANTVYDQTLSSVTMTGCSAGNNMNVKISRSGSDTATTAPNVYWVTLTFPRLLANQAN